MLETSKPTSVPRSAPPYAGGGSDVMRGRYGNWSADGPTSSSSLSDSQAPKVRLCVICHLSSVVLCEYSNVRIVTLLFDSKRMRLFEIFKYSSFVHNAVFGNDNGDSNMTNCRHFGCL